MNSVPPQVVDQWIAHELVKQESGKRTQQMSPKEALKQLKQLG